MPAWFVIAYYAIALAITAYSVYAAVTANQPDEVSGTQRRNALTGDAEAPWTYVYGEVVTGGHVAWAGVGGDDDQWTGLDIVIASHPIEALVAIQIGEWVFPLTTVAAGSNSYNGRGLILNTGQTLTDDYPADWYIPVYSGEGHADSSRWWRRPQDDRNGQPRPHLGIKWWPGTRTGTEAGMTARFGADYSSVARKFIGHTVVSIIYRVNTELGTLGNIPAIKFHVKGKNNLALNDSGSSTGYSANAAAVLADVMKELCGIPASDIVNHVGGGLASLIAECASTAWDPQGTAALYEYHGVIRDDVDLVDVLQQVTKHLMGGFSERGSKVVIWTGTARSSVMDLTVDDFAGGSAVRTAPVPQESWVNTYIPHRVVRTANDADGKIRLHGEMEPAKKAYEAAYVTEDGGVVLRQDVRWEGCDLARRARHMALIALDTLRLGDRYSRKFKRRAVRLEVGDVITITDPTRLSGSPKFRVIHKGAPDADWNVEITAVRYENAIYDPRAVTEDAIGVLFRGNGTIMPLVTGLAATVLEGSAQVQADGTIAVDVQVSWNLVTNILVRASGHIRIGWKKSTESFPRKATTVPGDEIHAVLPGLVQGTTYHIRARAEGGATAGRSDIPVGEWSANISFTPDSGFTIMPGPPGSASWGDNLIDNPSFEHGSSATSAPAWEAQITAPATFAIGASGGKFGERVAMITFNDSVASQYLRTNTNGPYGGLIPVEPGQRYLIVFWVYAGATNDDIEIRANLQFYGAAGKTDFIQTDTAGSRIITTVDETKWLRVKAVHSVPNDPDIAFMRLQAAAEASGDVTTYVLFDGFRVRRQVGGTSNLVVSTVSLNTGDTGVGLTWTSLRSIVGSTPGDAVTIRAQFEARVGDAGSAGADVSLQIRVVRYDLDGVSNETVIATEVVGDPVSPGTPWGSWAERAFVATDDTGAQGSYIWRCQFRATGANGQAQVRERMISWALEEESTST
jgi:hypothetical protein